MGEPGPHTPGSLHLHVSKYVHRSRKILKVFKILRGCSASTVSRAGSVRVEIGNQFVKRFHLCTCKESSTKSLR